MLKIMMKDNTGRKEMKKKTDSKKIEMQIETWKGNQGIMVKMMIH